MAVWNSYLSPRKFPKTISPCRVAFSLHVISLQTASNVGVIRSSSKARTTRVLDFGYAFPAMLSMVDRSCSNGSL